MGAPRPPRTRSARAAVSAGAALQLELWDGSAVGSAPASIPAPVLFPRVTATRALARLSSASRALAMVRETLHFFPELRDASLTVGLTRAAAGYASLEEDRIWVNPYRLSRHTIAHELVHLLERRGLVPQSERGTDLFALARHPDLADDLPAYVRVPAAFRETWLRTPALERRRWMGPLLHEVAGQALLRRQEGRRAYIVWFEAELERRWGVGR